jgi:hypothetical protein
MPPRDITSILSQHHARRQAERAQGQAHDPELVSGEAVKDAVPGVALAQHPWANEVGGDVGADELAQALGTMQRLLAVLQPAPPAEVDESAPGHRYQSGAARV